MSFDEELTQAFDTLTARLRGEIDREVERRTAEQAAILAEQAAETAVVPTTADGSAVRLAGGFDAIDAARSLTAILDALLAFAADETPEASLWLIRGGRPHRWRAAGSGDGDDVPSPSLDEGLALAIAGQTVAVLLANANSALTTQNSELALLTRYAAKSLEARTAFTTARALTQHGSADRGVRSAASSAGSSADSEDETSARRYARLLVSEIKLYHEPAVIDGRRDRDLATRLGGEIARARVMYEERVPVQVRERHDFFHEELVKTLANGDATLLELRT